MGKFELNQSMHGLNAFSSFEDALLARTEP
jgi:hypothetical protein